MLAKLGEQMRRTAMQEGRAEGLEKGLEEGIEKGIEQGIEKGIEEGAMQAMESARRVQAQLCITLLEERFGPLNRFSQGRVDEASFEELSQWLLKLHKTESVQALLEGE